MKNRMFQIGMIFVIFCVFFYAAANLYLYGKQSLAQQKENASLKKIVYNKGQDHTDQNNTGSENPVVSSVSENAFFDDTPDDEYIPPSYDQLLSINPDYVFWISITGTKIDNPVVQRDNDYYLSHSFYNKKNGHGCIFLDESCDPFGQFLLLHGHHMKDGSMFSGLDRFKKTAFRKENRSVCIMTQYGKQTYEVFAGMFSDQTQEDFFDYGDFPDEGSFSDYFENVKAQSFFFEYEPEISDDFLILSTCSYGTADQRLVIYARKI